MKTIVNIAGYMRVKRNVIACDGLTMITSSNKCQIERVIKVRQCDEILTPEMFASRTGCEVIIGSKIYKQ